MTVTGAISCCTTCWGEAEVLGDGDPYPLSLNKQAWCITNAKALWRDVSWRGRSTVIPGVPGRRSNPRRRDQTDYALDFMVVGIVDEDDVLNDDEEQGLLDNFAYLRQYAFDPPDPPATGRTWRLTSPDTLTTVEFDVQAPEDGESFVTNRENSGLWVGKLHIIVPIPET